LKLLTIASWGVDFRLGNNEGYFYGCANLTISATDPLDLTNTTTLESIFQSCASLTTAPTMTLWDTSEVTSLANMFERALLFNQDIGNWNTGKVTSMLSAFFHAEAFNQDISGWDIAKVESMYMTFRYADVFNQDISGWDTGKVTTMYAMFNYALVFDQDISGWDVTALTNATAMFNFGALSTANYDLLLIGWEGQAVLDNVTFSCGSSKYTGGGAAATARQALIDDHTWDITDGGTV